MLMPMLTAHPPLIPTHFDRKINALAPGLPPPWPPITASIVSIPCFRILPAYFKILPFHAEN